MEPTLNNRDDSAKSPGRLRIASFDISGKIFGNHSIEFPFSSDDAVPSMLILAGRNGSGKTTILRMIAGLLDLDFDVFRKTPFDVCHLRLSDGNVLSVIYTDDKEYPLSVTFGELSAKLRLVGGPHSDPELAKQVLEFRVKVGPILRQIDFELLDIHRSIALRESGGDEPWVVTAEGHRRRVEHREDGRAKGRMTLALRVKKFMSEAQIDYRMFFAADELELLPRILRRFNAGTQPSTQGELKKRIQIVQTQFEQVRHFGLQADDADLNSLAELLDREEAKNSYALIMVEAYVEMQESRQKARDLISKRLIEFELIMDEFLANKIVRIDAQSGLIITADNKELNEIQLSSGEYHFLFMMVAALLCKRQGSIIAIDEPELSLHTTWQRKIVDALTRCATGASPLFLFATHSIAIAAEHPTSVYKLTNFE